MLHEALGSRQIQPWPGPGPARSTPRTMPSDETQTSLRVFRFVFVLIAQELMPHVHLRRPRRWWGGGGHGALGHLETTGVVTVAVENAG